MIEVLTPITTDDTATSSTPTRLNFYEAIKKLTEGKHVSKLEWNDRGTYVCLCDDILHIWIKGEKHTWTVSLADIEGTDYIVIN